MTTRRIPNCAGCGADLRKAEARVLLMWDAYRGKPVIGWCEKRCNWGINDPEFMKLRPQGPDEPPDDSRLDEVLTSVAARGTDRVLWLRKGELKHRWPPGRTP